MIDVVITIPQPAALDTEIVTESETDIQIHSTPMLLLVLATSGGLAIGICRSAIRDKRFSADGLVSCSELLGGAISRRSLRG